MPSLPSRPCSYPGCGKLVRDGTGRCDKHKVKEGSFADKHRGSRHERGYGGKWDRIRKRILTRDAGLCQECLRQGCYTVVGLEKYSAFVDHIIPKAQGGTDDDNNLQLLCRQCHKEKTDREKNDARASRGKNTQTSV